jgi:hypothetical protein
MSPWGLNLIYLVQCHQMALVTGRGPSWYLFHDLVVRIHDLVVRI